METECSGWRHRVLDHRRLKVLVLLIFLALGPSLGQASSSTSEEANQCRIDDLHWNYLQPPAKIGLLIIHEGACNMRSNDESYGLDSGSHPGINVTVGRLNNTLRGSWCISMIANTLARSEAPVVMFYESDLTAIGNIHLTQSRLNLTIRDSFASFEFPKQAISQYVRLQLCVESNELYFYYECEQMASQSFSNPQFQENDIIGILRDLRDDSASRYETGLAGLYILGCSGPNVARDDIAQLQCISNPPNCSVNITRPSEVVSNYVKQLEEPEQPVSTVSVQCPEFGGGGTISPIPTSTECLTTATPTPQTVTCDCSSQQLRHTRSQVDRWRNAFIATLLILTILSAVLANALTIVIILWRRSSSSSS